MYKRRRFSDPDDKLVAAPGHLNLNALSVDKIDVAKTMTVRGDGVPGGTVVTKLYGRSEVDYCVSSDLALTGPGIHFYNGNNGMDVKGLEQYSYGDGSTLSATIFANTPTITYDWVRVGDAITITVDAIVSFNLAGAGAGYLITSALPLYLRPKTGFVALVSCGNGTNIYIGNALFQTNGVISFDLTHDGTTNWVVTNDCTVQAFSVSFKGV